jgi:hypothetical protein
MSESNQKRRWLRFSLRTLLLLVTGLCVWLGIQVNRAREQREALKALVQRHPTIQSNFEYDYQLVPDVGAAQRQGLSADILYYRHGEGSLPEPQWLISLMGVDFFHNIVNVDLRATARDNDLADLEHLPNLRELLLGEAPVTSDGLRHLARLTEMDELELDDTQVDDEGMAWLAGLSKLTRLNLDGTRVGDRGLEHIGRLHRLWALVLDQTLVTDAGMPCVAQLTNLEVLGLVNTQITDAGARHLAKLPNLVLLALAGTQITDASIPVLRQLTTLKELHIRRTKLTLEGIKRLKASLPSTAVYSD